MKPTHVLLALVCAATFAACGGGGATIGPAPQPGSSGTASSAPSGTPQRTPSPSPSPSGGTTPTPSPTPTSSGATTQGIPFPSDTDSDAFYAQPASFPNTTRGAILDSRAVTYEPDAVPQPQSAWQIKFVSRDLAGNPIASVATVVKPSTAFSGGPTPLLAVAYYENSLGDECAPSHATTGYTGNDPSNTEGSFPLQGLNEGMTLVFPDHLGPNTEYGIGPLHGQIVLDSLRAAENFQPLGLNAQTPVGIEGYSGGAIATAWAVAMRKTYAPELNVVAVASGGTPADLKLVFKQFDSVTGGNALFSIGYDLMIGINRAFPNFVTPILNAKGVAAANSLRNGCGGNTTDGSANPTGMFADYTTIADPIDSAQWAPVLQKLKLPDSGGTPIDPIFVYHSMVDELVPVAQTTTLVNAWCAAGVHIAYYQGVQGDHVTFDATMAPLVFVYLNSRFKGQGDNVPLGTTTCN